MALFSSWHLLCLSLHLPAVSCILMASNCEFFGNERTVSGCTIILHSILIMADNKSTGSSKIPLLFILLCSCYKVLYIDFRKGNIKYVKSQSGSFPPRRFYTSACCLLLHLFTLSCYLSEAMLRMCRNLAQTFPWLKFSLVLTRPFVVFICICKTVFLEMFNRVVIFQIE